MTSTGKGQEGDMHRKQVIHAHFFVHIKVRFFLLPHKDCWDIDFFMVFSVIKWWRHLL